MNFTSHDYLYKEKGSINDQVLKFGWYLGATQTMSKTVGSPELPQKAFSSFELKGQYIGFIGVTIEEMGPLPGPI